MRTIFIGDIHGCYDEFMLLIKKLDIKKNDIVYLVGDMINKGPKSYKVLNFVYKNRDQYKCILGNHEINFLRYIDGEKTSYWGFEDIKEGVEKNNTYKYIDYLRTLNTSIEKKEFLLIHGGLIPGKSVQDHHVDEITRLREYKGKPWHKYYQGDKLVIYGHWAIQGLKKTKNTIGLDSGCVYGKQLTAYILETDEIVQQKALKPYVLIGKNKFEKYLYKIKWYLNLIK